MLEDSMTDGLWLKGISGVLNWIEFELYLSNIENKYLYWIVILRPAALRCIKIKKINNKL